MFSERKQKLLSWGLIIVFMTVAVSIKECYSKNIHYKYEGEVVFPWITESFSQSKNITLIKDDILHGPRTFDIDEYGNYYIGDSECVKKYSRKGDLISIYGFPYYHEDKKEKKGGVGRVKDVRVDNEGSVYVTTTLYKQKEGNKLIKYNSNGSVEWEEHYSKYGGNSYGSIKVNNESKYMFLHTRNKKQKVIDFDGNSIECDFNKNTQFDKRGNVYSWRSSRKINNKREVELVKKEKMSIEKGGIKKGYRDRTIWRKKKIYSKNPSSKKVTILEDEIAYANCMDLDYSFVDICGFNGELITRIRLRDSEDEEYKKAIGYCVRFNNQGDLYQMYYDKEGLKISKWQRLAK